MKFFVIRPLALFFCLAGAGSLFAATDDAGKRRALEPPARVVSLVPAASEVLAAIGAAEAIAGLTYQDVHLAELAGKPVVGGPSTPQWALIAEARPDLLIVAPGQVAEAGAKMPGINLLVWNDQADLAEADFRISVLGELFQRPDGAEKVNLENRELLELIAQKTAKITEDKRLRVMRLWRTETPGELMTPGEDSFETELIAAAGGLPPKMGPGGYVPVTLEAWQKFNPQAVYDCGPGRKELMELLNRPGWNEAEAVKNSNVHYFPCALTDWAAAHTGYFAAWFSSMLYGRYFADRQNLIRPEEILSDRLLADRLLADRPAALDHPYIKKARLIESRIFDFVHRTLLIDFDKPRLVVSTAGGQRTVSAVGNSFSPTPTWGIYHELGLARAQENLFRVLKLDPAKAEILGTGADMNNLAVRSASFKEMTVTALVTAGVEGNALRVGKDTGAYYEPGTINVILLSSHALSPGAAARAIITATEAKTAALWDMDIRSVQSKAPATGTGTDGVIVVSGDLKPELIYSGGHSTLGQLISETVYAGVREALLKQNGKLPVRHIFERLAERGLSVSGLLAGEREGDDSKFENLLLTPRYRAFVEAAFSLSDAAETGQVSDLALFEAWALAVAGEIAGRPVAKIEFFIGLSEASAPTAPGPTSPAPLATALNALATGLKHSGQARPSQ